MSFFRFLFSLCVGGSVAGWFQFLGGIANCFSSTVYSPAAVEELKEKSLDFLTFPELEAAVVKDVEFLKASKVVPDSVTISGWVYEVETGRTRRVV